MHLSEIVDHLSIPFDPADVQVRPGAVSGDGASALALAYADWRAYADRLDAVVGPEHWSIRLVPWGEHRIIAELTIAGITKAASGEGEPDDPNGGTTAEAQAKKRACAEFGLGRYFYRLPKRWGRGSGDRRSFRFADGEERRLVQQMYQQANLLPSHAHECDPAPDTLPPADSPGDHQRNGNGTTPNRLARARAALKEAQERAAQPVPARQAPNREEAASDRQLGKIAGMLRSLTPAGLQPVQTKFGLDLAGVSSRDDLRALGLSKRQASALIDALNVAELVP